MGVAGQVTPRARASSGTGPRSAVPAREGPLCCSALVPREKQKGLLCVGTSASSLERPQTHTGHRHRLLGWPLCSLGSARPACLPRVSPASTSSLWDCGLASIWRPSLHLSGLVRCGPPWGSHAPYSGEDGRGRPEAALAGAGGKWLGGGTRKPAHCYSDPASEACPGCRVCILAPSSTLTRREAWRRAGEPLQGWAQAPHPRSTISFLSVPPSCSESEQTPSVGRGRGL